MRPDWSNSAVLSLLAVAEAASVKSRLSFQPNDPPLANNDTGKTFNVPLVDSHDDYADYQWYATIQVGSPPQNLTVVIDSGSPDLVLPGSNCTSDCDNETVFDFAKSSTFKNGNGKEYSESYATGLKADPLPEIATASGTIDFDTVSLGGASVSGMDIFLEDKVPAALRELPIAGIIGFSPPYTNGNGGWFWRLAAQEILAEPIFSLALNTVAKDGPDSQGLLTLGGTDKSRYSGEVKYFGLSNSGAWATDTQSFTINGHYSKADQETSYTVLDTGTAYVQTPDGDTASAIYSSISSEIKPIGDLGVWGASCEVMEKLEPHISFELGVRNSTLSMTVPSTSFNLGPLPDQNDLCQGVFLGPGRSGYQGAWIIGSPLLKGYYTVWDHPNLRLGVAELK